MGLFGTYDQKEPHHAYCIEAHPDAVRGEIHKFVEEVLGVATKGSPDYWTGIYDQFGIAESRTLREMQAGKAMSGGRRVFVIETDFITSEAQNALLKIFEDPRPGVHFFFVIANTEVLLPTLRSRMQLLKAEGGTEAGDISVMNFLTGSISERNKLVAPLIKEKDKKGTLALLNNIERELGGNIPRAEDIIILKDIHRFRSYLQGRAPSIKMIVEYVVLMTPRKNP